MLKIYEGEYEQIVLETYSPLTMEGKALLEERKKKYVQSLSLVVQHLNVKAQVLIEDLKASNLTLSPETSAQLEEIRTCTAARLLQGFKG